MKPASRRKLADIAGRVKDLRSRCVTYLRAKEDDDRQVPRVCAIVIREGQWLVKLCRTLLVRANKVYKPTEQEAKVIVAAESFFTQLADAHEEEMERNHFVYRMDCDFITHMDRLCVLARKVDSLVAAALASVARTVDDADTQDELEEQEEIDAEMTS